MDKKGGAKMNKLKELREKNCLKQEELAGMLGVAQSTVSMWETGYAFPRADKLPALAKILKCTVDELLCKDTA